MMTRFVFVLALAGTTLAAAPLTAQVRSRAGGDVPQGHRPPPGMCRIWIDGVPPGQQPAPTDCPTAVRNRPANGRVVFGDDWRTRGKARPPKSGSRLGWTPAPHDAGRPLERDDDRNDRDDRRGGDAAAMLPAMIAGILIGRGERTGDVARWLGDADVTARYVDTDRDGRPERVTWLDADGHVMQIWTDHDGDGRADQVEMFRDGRRVRVIGQ